jgi:nucleoside-diphosphate-sugar epimerase
MRVFLAGATGAIGTRLVPLLVVDGHEVYAMTRRREMVRELRAEGTIPVVADGLDRAAVIQAVRAAEPEIVIHQMTALSKLGDVRHFDRDFAATNRLRTDGTRNLVDAAALVGARRLIAQSFAGWPYARIGGPVKSEHAPLDEHPPRRQRESIAAIRGLERAVLAEDDVEGIVLRYGPLYGPGTSIAPNGAPVLSLRRKRWPVVGSGDGVWSFCHAEDAALATVHALHYAEAGVYNIVDDNPARVRDWLPALAEAAGAPEPSHVPAWVGRMVAGGVGVSMMTTVRGASNSKARHEMGWEPAHPDWRAGFAEMFGHVAPSRR